MDYFNVPMLLSRHQKKVKRFLTFFLYFSPLATCLCFLVNCRSIEDNNQKLPAKYHQPKYLSSYWIQAQKFPVDGIEAEAINWNQPYIFFPPLRLDEQGQVSENYSLSTTEKANDKNDLETIYHYSSDYTIRAKGFSGFIDTLATFFDKSATSFHVYKMPENIDQAFLIKYYYKLGDAQALKASNETYQMILIISIEWMKIEDQKIALEKVWKGEMVLNLSQSIDQIEAINLGYHKLSQYVLKNGAEKDRANLLNF